ncbi:MAG: hypothetical protein PHO65_02070 [Sulfurovum sp.]|nr:hypothetical protein [Sulfurovum sp.]
MRGSNHASESLEEERQSLFNEKIDSRGVVILSGCREVKRNTALPSEAVNQQEVSVLFKHQPE